MRIVLIQNQVARFNLLGTEESLAFSMKIVDDENNIVERDGVKCIARLQKTENALYVREELEQLFDKAEFAQIVALCIEETNRSDTIAESKAFIDVYVNHFDELKHSYEDAKKKLLQDKIEALKKELAKTNMSEDTYEMAEILKGLASKEREMSDNYVKWSEDYKKSSPQYKDYMKKAKERRLKACELNDEYDKLYVTLEKRLGVGV